MSVPATRADRRRARLRELALSPAATLSAHRKADICMALAAGAATRDEVLRAHRLSGPQLDQWMLGARLLGVRTRAQSRR